MDLIETIKQMGVVGAGGAGFPTHVKLGNQVEIVIANGTECEPLLFNDKYILSEHGNDVIQGLKVVLQATSAKKGIIALKKKQTQIVERVKSFIADQENISLALLDDFYPAGDEQILVYMVTGRVIPQGQLPITVGCVVSNVETLRNIHFAMMGKPVTRRTLTCIGEVRDPSVVIAHIGMSIDDVISQCGGVLVENPVVIVGGPMMGYIEKDLNTPITKTMTGLIVLPEDHFLVRKKSMPMSWVVKQSKAACCQCTYCTELCPRYLLGHELYPHKIMRNINLGLDIPPEVIENALLCSECGLCEVFACPMDLSPRMVNHFIKVSLSEANYHPQLTLKKNQSRVSDLVNRKIPVSRVKERLRIRQYDRLEIKTGLETNPKRVEIPLKQHIGDVSIPVVQEGDLVEEGALIGEIPSGSLGARVHASISGRVTLVNNERVIIKG
ncbi:MAG: hypothetical protein GX428_03110 [Candidatus Atribacteria bacterium]|nr:hypothetical protein [Candidatus Atribacteria bacterium]